MVFMHRTAQLVLVVGVITLGLAGCASGRNGPDPDTKAPKGPHTLKKLTVAERQQAMERANVWRPLNTASLDLIKGPTMPASLRIPSAVTCAFVFPDKPISGLTPKFLCDLGKGGKHDIVKVKYGDKNGEVYAEVAGSRLLWVLGFQADVMYPTRVTCVGCPQDPFATSGENWQRGSPTDIATRVFEPAIIERAGGSSIEVPGYEGWAWPELDKLGKTPGPSTSLRASGATRAQLDAFKLAAVFIQHSDSKAEQQEIVCDDGKKQKDAKGNETCSSSWLVIKDLGATFGKATKLNSSKMNLSDWESAPMWKDPKQCIADMPRSLTGTLEDPQISEAGRRFLAAQMAKLSDKQIRDLFTISNVVKRGDTVNDWVRVFKKKRAEIVAARCAA